MTAAADYMWIRWAGSGRELYYVAGDSLMRVPFDPAAGPTGPPRLVFRTPGQVADVSLDGRRFLTVQTPPETAPRRIQVVLNWMNELGASSAR